MPSQTLRPNGAGSSTTFNPVGDATNWQCVDDFVGPDADVTYNSTFTGSSGDDLFTHTTMSAIGASETITHVTVTYTARYNGGSSAQLIPKVRIGGVTYTGSAINVINTYTNYPVIYTFVPGTSSPWTVTDVNNLEIGYASGGLTINELRVTRVTLEPFYTKNTPATLFMIGD